MLYNSLAMVAVQSGTVCRSGRVPVCYSASTFAPVKSFTHVSVRTDDEVYNGKTAAISFIYLFIVLMISKILNINMPQELILISSSQRNSILWPYNIIFLKVYANMNERLDYWRKSADR
jgi:hypothetical protein